MVPPWVFALLALVGGSALAVQAGVNSQLGKGLESPMLGAFVSFAIGTVGLGVAAALVRPGIPDTPTLGAMPVWAWTGGLLGALYVLAAILAAPRLGAASLITLVVAGQLTTSLALDHFGLAGFPVHPISGSRVVGAVLLAAGVVLIRMT